MHISKGHKQNDPDEKERIIKNFGKDKNFLGFERVWKENENSQGLALSRSF